MNGTYGEVVQIVFQRGYHPNADNLRHRMPEAIVLHCPSYTGKPFYDEPERRKWVPIRPQTVTDEQHHVIKQTRFALVLA